MRALCPSSRFGCSSVVGIWDLFDPSFSIGFHPSLNILVASVMVLLACVLVAPQE